ncbi:alpha/beta fold hydrolase [Streptomyces sp. JJ36]|uniref:alpha/beta fold hydrolase n=1 Tax=Streptomyces sp. JJ36 TaxID=2736645 RepID=UPI001F444D14|nr:alpha/beta fold hydrolase [Streptomyces sp. JJ36]MCF6523384.1 alpha/beta fold hydrolase [Streptomyces sp. JJ36]
MPTLRVNGVTLAYTDTGAPEDRPDAPTVLFGHGLLFGGWMFRHQIDALRRRYRCVALDWRGQGETPATRDGYDMDSLTADTAALVEELGTGPVHYAGLSMGGFVGLRLAARRGELLRSLTLLDTSADEEEPDEARRHRLLAAIYRAAGISPVRSRVLPLMFGPAFLASPASGPLIEEWTRRLSRLDRAAVRRAVLAVAARKPVRAELAAVSVPTLVVVGADDAATPPFRAERIAAGVAGARLEVVPDAGHSSTLEQPEAVTALLTEFLASVDPG